MRSAAGEGQTHRYIDGQFVGAVGPTGSGLDERWALGSELLLFADESNDTAAGFASSIFIIDMTLAEVQALDAGSWFTLDFVGEKTPTLTDLAENPAYAKKLAEMEALLKTEMERHHDPYPLWN
ncbi:MAG: hypothetical protein ACJA16_005273 [Akkermansiaceae bacterium]|jgi:hypothetical protein